MQDKKWDVIITSKQSDLSLSWKELWRYRDLIYMFVKRDFVSIYKQTILGPLWFFIQPIFTTVIYIVIFSGIANLPTDQVPPILFYLTGILFWNFFSAVLSKSSDTFIQNSNIFGKVYFPRMVVPVSYVSSALLTFMLQLILFLMVYIYYIFFTTNIEIIVNGYVFLFPIFIIVLTLYSLGIGILISSITVKYRDLRFVVTFGLQLLLYASPVVYSMSSVPSGWLKILLGLNPLTQIIVGFRYAVFSKGEFDLLEFGVSALLAIVLFLVGFIFFSRAEKNFIDTI